MVDLKQCKIIWIHSLLLLLLTNNILLCLHPTLHGGATHLRVPDLLCWRRIEEIISSLLVMWRLIALVRLLAV